MVRQDAKRAEKIANERIEYLYSLAKERLEKIPADSRRYIRMLREMATKHNIRITDKKRTFCKECNTVLIEGKTSQTRIRDDRRIITCKHCGAIKRLGLK